MSQAAIKVRNLPLEAVQTRSFQGVFRRLRMVGAGLLCLLFFGVPWLQWDARQAVLWDIGQRQFHLFHLTYWPQDLPLLAGLLVVGAIALFLSTLFVARVWCGYVCPQSVWTWAFMRAERWAEGERHQRIRLAASGWGLSKLRKKTLKHLLWGMMALATGVTFMGYFYPVRELALQLMTFELLSVAWFWVGVIAILTYLNAGFAREKVCLHMCPYGRLQSAMFDRETLVVAYDTNRTDCIDCTLCVQVCPTGIDIRDGLQMACIGCAACIDVCDTVMAQVQRPKGLIRYASESQLQGQALRLWRPRALVSLVTVAVASALLIVLFITRSGVEVMLTKDRMLYRTLDDGTIENVFTLKLTNKWQQPRTVQLRVRGDAGITHDPLPHLRLGAAEVVALPMQLRVAPEQLETLNRAFALVVEDSAGERVATAQGRLSVPRVNH